MSEGRSDDINNKQWEGSGVWDLLVLQCEIQHEIDIKGLQTSSEWMLQAHVQGA